MKRTKEGLGGFELPSDNMHLFEIQDDIGYIEKDGVATNRLSFRLAIADDETESSSCFQRCDLGTSGGREALACILLNIKMAEPMEKKYKLEGAEKMTEQQWGNAFLDITSKDAEAKEIAGKLVNAFVAKGPGKTFYAESKVRKSTYIDKQTGEKKESTNVNLPVMRPNDDAEAKKIVKDRLSGKGGNDKAAPKAAEAASGGDDDFL